MIELQIPGPPVAQGRARAFALMRGGKPVLRDGRPVILFHDPDTSKVWKTGAAWHMKAAMGGRPPLEGPLLLIVRAYFQMPQALHRKRDGATPMQWHDKRPDGDNVLKAVKDAGKGILWRDDAQITGALILKIVAAQGVAPRVAVQLRALHGAAVDALHVSLSALDLAAPPTPPPAAP